MDLLYAGPFVFLQSKRAARLDSSFGESYEKCFVITSSDEFNIAIKFEQSMFYL